MRAGQELENYYEYASRRSIRNVLFLKGDGEQVSIHDMVNGTTDTIAFSDYVH
jgi:hypothetical protein